MKQSKIEKISWFWTNIYKILFFIRKTYWWATKNGLFVLELVKNLVFNICSSRLSRVWITPNSFVII